MTHLLFICTLNRWRSLTAEHLFRGVPGYEVRSAGTAWHARVRVKARDIQWADVIYVMERKHQEIIHKRFAQYLDHKMVICLNIPDIYPYMDEDLITLLTESVQLEVE
jgi:predicted protein tyrosine phosphatase